MSLELDTPWTAAAKVVSDLIDRFVPDKTEAARQKFEAMGQIQELQKAQLAAAVATDQAQAATNTAEASSGNRFNSGWRPAIGWVCAAALGYDFLLQPLLSWASTGFLHAPPPPQLDIATLLELLGCMLGLSTQRTIERINRVIPPGK
jgi:hypothetical protein